MLINTNFFIRKLNNPLKGSNIFKNPIRSLKTDNFFQHKKIVIVKRMKYNNFYDYIKIIGKKSMSDFNFFIYTFSISGFIFTTPYYIYTIFKQYTKNDYGWKLASFGSKIIQFIFGSLVITGFSYTYWIYLMPDIWFLVIPATIIWNISIERSRERVEAEVEKFFND